MHLCYSGPAKNFEKVMAPIRALGKPVFDGIAPVDYVDLQRSWDQTDPRNQGEYLKSGFINEFPAELVDKLVDDFEPDPQRSTQVYFQHSGGAIGRVRADATAFAHRKSMANMLKVVSWDVDFDPQPHIDYSRNYWSGVESFTDGWYTNETLDEPQRVRNANYQGNYDRLLAVKQQYDPTNLFRLNANIDPDA
jgi:hypothetical protein